MVQQAKKADPNLCLAQAQYSYSLQYYRKSIEKYVEASTLFKENGNLHMGIYCFNTAISIADNAAMFYIRNDRFDVAVDYLLIYRDLAARSGNDALIRYGDGLLFNSADIAFSRSLANTWHHESKENHEMVVLEASKALKMLDIMKDYVSIETHSNDILELNLKISIAEVNIGLKKWDKLDFAGAMSSFEIAQRRAIAAGDEKLTGSITRLKASLHEKSKIMDAVNAIRK